MSVRRTDGPSWKIHVCSTNKWTLLENYKKVAPGKKEQIFSKTVSVAASEITLRVDWYFIDSTRIIYLSKISVLTQTEKNEKTLLYSVSGKKTEQ